MSESHTRDSDHPSSADGHAHGSRWNTESERLALRVEELHRERDSLEERCRQREAELGSIQTSKMWRWWIRYHTLRRAIRAVVSPVLKPRATRQPAAASETQIEGSGPGAEQLVSQQRDPPAGNAPSPTEVAEEGRGVSESQTVETPHEPPRIAPEPDAPPEPFDPEPLRPRVTWRTAQAAPSAGPQGSVLVLGIYLANRQNNVTDIVESIAGATSFQVEQRWIALGGGPPNRLVADVTVERISELTPKGKLINSQIDAVDLVGFDYVVLCDDDVVLPRDFLDSFLGLQERLQYRIAQPARTLNSYIDLPIVEQHPGLIARQTLFVEQGPVVSFHRSVLDLVFPFDLTSPMGWGLENLWSLRVSGRGLKMGIIDNVPVDHSMRRPVANYAWDEADRGRSALHASTAHRPTEECFKIVDIVLPEDLDP